eukprot:gene39946-48653_t
MLLLRATTNPNLALVDILGVYADVQSFAPSVVSVFNQDPFTLFHEGSFFIDGASGPFLKFPSSSSFSFNWGSEGITVDAWIRCTDVSNTLPAFIGLFDTVSAGNYWSFGPRRQNDNTFRLQLYVWSPYVLLTGTTIIPFNTWTHIAMSATGGTVRLFVNGVLDTSIAIASVTTGTYSISCGRYGNSANYFTGFVSSLRIVRGPGLYTAAFTPSIFPLTPVGNTVLLIRSTTPSNLLPTISPTETPTVLPTAEPTVILTVIPTVVPTVRPSEVPTATPEVPTATPSVTPSVRPSVVPSCSPSLSPTVAPSIAPSVVPTVVPTVRPSEVPTATPSVTPSLQPSSHPSSHPSACPSSQPSSNPTVDISSLGSILYTPMIRTSNTGSFLLQACGSLYVWGDTKSGGSLTSTRVSSYVGEYGVVKVVSSSAAFAALLGNGGIIAWGSDTQTKGWEDYLEPEKDTDRVVDVVANNQAFAALTQSGRVICFGLSTMGGSLPDSSSFQEALSAGVVGLVAASGGAFAAVKYDGSVYSWGVRHLGGEQSPESSLSKLTRIRHVAASEGAFAGQRADGSFVTWGNCYYGGCVSASQAGFRLGLVLASSMAFVGITTDRQVVAWGRAQMGGMVPPSIASYVRESVDKVDYMVSTQGAI